MQAFSDLLGMMEFRSIEYAPKQVNVEPTPDGGFLLTSPLELRPYEENLGQMLRRWVREAPERIFLSERGADGTWQNLSYGEAGRLVDAVAQSLIDRGLGPHRPLMILSGNSVSHALLMLGAFLAGVPVVPVPVPFSLMSNRFTMLKGILAEVRPALIFAEDGNAFARALKALDLNGVEVVVREGKVPGVRATLFPALLETKPTEEVEDAFARVGPASVAKILFCNDATGELRGVVNTHGMLCANQQMMAQIWPFLAMEPPVLIDWIPWNQTFGGNHNFNMVLKHGGTLYIDDGQPVPGQIQQTVNNLAEISPTIYFNVPAGYSMLLPHIERKEELRRTFFKNLRLIFYAASQLAADIRERLETASVRTSGRKVPMTASWGAPHTSPAATSVYFPIDCKDVFGVPLPGVLLKMVPKEDYFELRVKGPNVTPGYFNRPDLNAAAFDKWGFFRIGDACTFADPDDPAKGIVFTGRIPDESAVARGGMEAYRGILTPPFCPDLL